MSEPITTADALKRNYIKPGSPEHLALLEGSYGLTLKEAETIVADWEKDHQAYPLEEVRRARAMIEAAKAKPQVIDQTPGWKRQRV
jgi:hypothetical protein